MRNTVTRRKLNTKPLIRNLTIQIAMRNKLSKSLILILVCVWAATQSSSLAATVPGGTTLVVRTVHSISSHQRVGRTVNFTLDQDVLINGKVVLQAGTPATGVVETAVGDFRKSNALTVNLTAVSVNGGTASVKTTGAYEPQTASTQKTRSGATVYLRDYIFPHNTRMDFRLAQPLHL